ncbi:hypothetical protein Zmor_022865 [Zophobas morio]|uniref:BAG domain-containing protein n=1 Tax=Zophobas morio TaxID=2755281 RepID=A0AA38M5T8_9CUCU|nr:hypothetical protein Zmor_022865 [Zophobas morio]
MSVKIPETSVMAENNGQRNAGEFVLGALNDDSDDSDDDTTIETYVTRILREITDIMDEMETIKNKVKVTSDKTELDNFAETLLQVIIKLDEIDARDHNAIREHRKDAILFAQGTLEFIDEKLEKK